VTVELSGRSVPIIGQTLALASAGIVTRAWKSTLENIGDQFVSEGTDETLVRVLADAQTSGGLLMSVPGERSAEAIDRLRDAGVTSCSEIGQVTPSGPARIILRP
jgi:selenide,water dikinase